MNRLETCISRKSTWEGRLEVDRLIIGRCLLYNTMSRHYRDQPVSPACRWTRWACNSIVNGTTYRRHTVRWRIHHAEQQLTYLTHSKHRAEHLLKSHYSRLLKPFHCQSTSIGRRSHILYYPACHPRLLSDMTSPCHRSLSATCSPGCGIGGKSQR